MSKVPFSEFNGSRARIQRLSDQRIFSGWIKSIGPDRVTLTAEDALPRETTERYLFQVQGESADAYFIATTTGLPLGGPKIVHGSTALQMLELPTFDYEFALSTRIEMRGSLQKPRKFIQAKAAKLTVDQRVAEVLVADVSAEGMGIIAWVEARKGQDAQIEIKDSRFKGCFPCEVRHCRPEPGIIGAYRLGLRFSGTDKKALKAWQNLLTSV